MASEVKVVVLGSGGVGKSALTIRFVTGDFLQEYDPTIEDSYRKSVTVDDSVVLFDILDTAGQEQFAALQDYWMKEGEAFIILYSITSRSTFSYHNVNRIEVFIEKLKRIKYDLDRIPIVIVGSKCDLDQKREVTKQEGNELANKWKCRFIEVSAKQAINVNEAFFECWREFKNIKDTTANDINQISKSSFSCNLCAKKQSLNINQNDNQIELKPISVAGQDAMDNGADALDKYSFKFYLVKTVPSDEITSPILSLKNFKISRKFYLKTFIKALLCGIFLPIIIIFQTISFVFNIFTRCYPLIYPYDDIHYSIFFDFLSIIIGRYPNEDPDIIKDKTWFFKQTKSQLINRFIISLFICLIYLISIYNILQINRNNLIGVSNMETFGPFLLFCILWILLSLWIAYEPKINTNLPSLLRLRSIKLFFGETYTHQSSAYKFLKAYSFSRESDKWKLSFSKTIIIIIFGLLYASIPGITRVTIGDESDNISSKTFITADEWIIQISAFIANFLLVSALIYSIEVQYSKHFDNYYQWMYDLTMLLDKTNINVDNYNDNKNKHFIPEKGRKFSSQLFLSLGRKSNALGWLEIRQFLSVEGMLLFGSQELPTLCLLLLTCSLTIFLFYRVYFINGNPLKSILFNGSLMLTIICLLSLIRITITGYQFEHIQEIQERLLTEQIFYLTCNYNKNNKNNKNNNDTKSVAIKRLNAVIEHKEEEDDDDDDEDEKDNNEMKALIQHDNKSIIDIYNYFENTEQITFLDNTLRIIKKKDIFPRLFNVKLNSVLSQAIAGIVLSGVITAFKLFFP